MPLQPRVSRAPQRAHLEIVSVTVDGVPQSDLAAYRAVDIQLMARLGGTAAAPAGAQLFATLRAQHEAYFLEAFGDPSMQRDQ